jgi:hypothetical protein
MNTSSRVVRYSSNVLRVPSSSMIVPTITLRASSLLASPSLSSLSSCCPSVSVRGVATSANVQIFEGVGKPFVATTIPIPKLAAGELLVRTTLATICGSDLHTVSGVRTEPTPLVLGHEGVGVIEAIGGGLKTMSRLGRSVSVGDRITWSIADSCGVCVPCATFQFPQYAHSQPPPSALFDDILKVV